MSEPPSSGRERIAEAKRRVDELKATAEARLETERGRRSWVRLAVRAWERDRARAGGLLAGGLAYRVFLWQVPAALLIVAVAGSFAQVAELDPGQVAEDAGLTASVAVAVGQAARDAGTSTWWLLFLGLWGVAWAGRGAARALHVVSVIAYEAPTRPVPATKASLVFTGLMFGAMGIQLVSDHLLGDSVWAKLLLVVLSVMATLALVVWAMTLLPRGGRRWTVVLPGAVLVGVSLLVLRLGSSVYFSGRIDRVQDVYGSIGIAIVILLVLYLAARVFVWGTFLSATFAGVDAGGESYDVLDAIESYARPSDAGPDAADTADEPAQGRYESRKLSEPR